jgi:DNA-binding HxlR family transcriptional regulator
MVQIAERKGQKKLSPHSVAEMVESIVGCKWSLGVLSAVRRDIVRPSAMLRELDGISTKVLNQRLGKMLRFGILHKRIYAEVPPRVEYALTPFGQRFIVLIDHIESLQQDVGQLREGSFAATEVRRAPARRA